MTGGRDGKAIAWDISTCTAIAEMSGHKGHVTSVTWYNDAEHNVFLTGAQVSVNVCLFLRQSPFVIPV